MPCRCRSAWRRRGSAARRCCRRSPRCPRWAATGSRGTAPRCPGLRQAFPRRREANRVRPSVHLSAHAQAISYLASRRPWSRVVATCPRMKADPGRRGPACPAPIACIPRTSNRPCRGRLKPFGARRGGALPVVAIGSSRADRETLQTLFAALPADSGFAVVVIVPLPDPEALSLAQALSRSCSLPVQHVARREALKAGHVHVISTEQAWRVRDGVLDTDGATPDRERNVATDLFLRALAESCGADAAAIVLAGNGAAGLSGVRRIKEHGGLTIAQDPAEAEAQGLPRTPVTAGLVDWVLPVARMAPRLMEFRRIEPLLRLPAAEPQPTDGDRRRWWRRRSGAARGAGLPAHAHRAGLLDLQAGDDAAAHRPAHAGQWRGRPARLPRAAAHAPRRGRRAACRTC